MKRSPRPRWCYICKHAPPCSAGSKCRTLKGQARREAYAEGYREKNAERLRLEAARLYREHNPNASDYRPRVN